MEAENLEISLLTKVLHKFKIFEVWEADIL